MRSINPEYAPREGAPPRESLVRAAPGDFQLLEHDAESMPTLVGHFARFNEWTEIRSQREGHFMERIAAGAFARSIADVVPKALFNHGKDPSIGDKVLGPITDLREDEHGGWYEVGLLDTAYNRELLPGLEAGLYGASFRFTVSADDYNAAPEASDYNPQGLPERTITEAQVLELGPVTFPAYAGASAGLRSLTDLFTFAELTADPLELAHTIEAVRAMSAVGAPTEKPAVLGEHDCPSCGAAVADGVDTCPACGADQNSRATEDGPPVDEPPATDEAKEASQAMADIDKYATLPELEQRAADVQLRLNEMHTEYGARALDTQAQTEWDDLREEKAALAERVAHVREREAEVSDAPEATRTNGDAAKAFQVVRQQTPTDIYDLDRYRMNARSVDDLIRLEREGAMRSVDMARFEHLPVVRELAQAHIAALLESIDDADPERNKAGGELARRILVTGAPAYKRGMDKYLRAMGGPVAFTPEEQRALGQGGSTGGYAIVYELDPTIIPTSNYSVNPYRAIARNIQISGTNEWRAATAAATTFAFSAEATEASDNAPTLAQPDIFVEKAQAFIPYSVEIGQDWGDLQAEMGRLLSDAKDDVEATKFTLGAGHASQEPKGIITAATSTTAPTGGVGTFAIADLYKLLEALPPRFRPRASWLGSLFTFDKVRQFDTAGGSGVWIDGFGQGNARGLGPAAGGMSVGGTNVNVGPRILGREAYECSAIDAALTTGKKPLVVGDFSYFVIVDRVGMQVETLPLVVGTNHRPTGQRGLYAWYRTSSDVLSASAFQVLAEP
jgi:HK97 family phage major capsid protein/HK97 family phage prohead protease